jgi:hypothetical protein
VRDRMTQCAGTMSCALRAQLNRSRQRSASAPTSWSSREGHPDLFRSRTVRNCAQPSALGTSVDPPRVASGW